MLNTKVAQCERLNIAFLSFYQFQKQAKLINEGKVKTRVI